MNFTVVTLFPKMFESPLAHSILKRAQERELISVRVFNLRDYATDRHRLTDDYPYGGGSGMVMKPEPLVAAIEHIRSLYAARVILLSPHGRLLKQGDAIRLANEKEIALICGRYEGVDERVKSFVDEEISIGDYTLSGGELPAMVLIDVVARLVPGVLGNEKSTAEESFSGGLLEYPQYTRPEEFRNLKVPEILLSGDHERVQQWRRQQSLRVTATHRPDLLSTAAISAQEKEQIRRRRTPVYVALLHHPVYDKNRQVVTTSVTNMDIHDIARSAKTYCVRAFYVITPTKTLQKLALKIIEHWQHGYGSQYNVTRKEALSLVRIIDDLERVIVDIERICGQKPRLVVTTARMGGGRTSFTQLREMLIDSSSPILILLGTGWGLADEIFARSDYVLEAIQGETEYNHLSVRSAAAIILDRLLGPH